MPFVEKSSSLSGGGCHHFYCPLCEPFWKLPTVGRASDIATLDEIARCDECGKNRFECDKCGTVPYRCEGCAEIFRYRELLQCHVAERNLLVCCDLCPLAFRDCKRRLKHQLEHHNKYGYRDLPYACAICYAKFGDVSETTDHVDAFHGNDTRRAKKYCCAYCRKRFVKPYNLVKHSCRVRERPLCNTEKRCSECRKRFGTLLAREEHELFVHGLFRRLKTFPCRNTPFCPFLFFSRTEETIHETSCEKTFPGTSRFRSDQETLFHSTYGMKRKSK